MITRAEFIQTAVDCGYASREKVERYAGDRDKFSDDDYIAVYRAANWYGGIKNRQWRNYEGTKCTKHLRNIDADDYLKGETE